MFHNFFKILWLIVWANVKNIVPSNQLELADTLSDKKGAIIVKFLSPSTVFRALVVIVNCDAFPEVEKVKNCTTCR